MNWRGLYIRGLTSGIAAASSQDSSVGLWISMWVETAMYSAYAPVETGYILASSGL